MNHYLSLAQVPSGRVVTIKNLGNNLDVKLCLSELGIFPGDKLEILSRSLGKGLCLKHQDHYCFALRHNQAAFIEVECE